VSFNGANGAGPSAGLIADANGNLIGTTEFGGAYGESGGGRGYGTVFEIAKTSGGYASTPTTLVNFNGTNGESPEAGLIADANGNLFGTTAYGGAYQEGTVFEIAKTAGGYATTPTTLVNFCSLANCADGAAPTGLIADANGNLFGTTAYGGAYGESGGGLGYGTVFEIAKTSGGYASTPTTLVSFNDSNGSEPLAGLIADANGNLFGTTYQGGAYGYGTVFEVTGSGFVPPVPLVLPPSEVATTASGLAYSRVGQTFNGTITITNIGNSTISGPCQILFTGLTAGVTLVDAAGHFSGSPYLTALPASAFIASGQSATVSVQFKNPLYATINFTPVIYSGNI